MGLLLLVVLPTGCPRFTVFYGAYLTVTLGLVAGELLFLRALYLRGRSRLLPAFKKLTGYGLVLHYVACALPRVDWNNAGLIGEGRTAFLFALSFLCLAAGSVLFVITGRPSVYAAFGLYSQEEARDRSLRRARLKRKKGILGGILEWIDVIAGAVILVILVNTFVFQLYVVPSESMVPAFLTGDRPFTVRIIAGPRIPLTAWRLPFIKPPARGDVVTIANPRYPENHRVDLKKYLSQAVSMLTFTAVNIDSKASDGSPKADPLVKRIVGLPGEKLMMVDDVLSVKTAADGDFHPLAEDLRWARTDLWKEPDAVRARISDIPIHKETRRLLDAFDAKKRDADPTALAAALASSGARIEARISALSATVAAFETRELPRMAQGVRERRDALIQEAAVGGDSAERINPIARRGAGAFEDLSLTLALAGSAPLREAFRAYARGPSSAPDTRNPYERGSRVLNMLIKENLLKRIERDLALIATGASVEEFDSDTDRGRLVEEARGLLTYLNNFYDVRNFPEFPEYLGPDQYFAMGDNRYNSLDFRYATVLRMRALDASDPASVLYPSLLAPFPLEKRFIEGYALFRVWPPSRVGSLK